MYLLTSISHLLCVLLPAAGDGSKQVSVQEYLNMAGVSGGKQYGK
jgi:hypothetical protein